MPSLPQGKKPKGQKTGGAKGIRSKAPISKALPTGKIANADQTAHKAASVVDGKVQAKPAKEECSSEVKVQVEQLLKEECENADLIEEFICRICLVHVVGCNPKLTSCSHLFCGDCMEQWFASHQTNQTWAQRAQSAGSERSAPCPVCKEQLQEGESLFSVSLNGNEESVMLWRMLSSLQVVCVNHASVRQDGKCCWKGQYGSYNAHVRACKNEPRGYVEAASSPVLEARCAPCEHLPGTSSPVLPEEVPTAWDDIDASSIAHDTEEPPKGRSSSIDTGSEQEKAASVHSATESTQASTAVDEMLATDSTEVSEVESPGTLEDMQRQGSLEDTVSSTTPKCAESPAAGDDSEDAMSDLMRSIRALFDLKLQDAVEGETEFRLPGAAMEEDQPGSALSKVADETPVAVPEAAVEKPRDIELSKVLHPFTAENGTQLSLQVGDTVEIIEKHSSGWTYGGLLSEGQAEAEGCCDLAEGWFPHWAVSV